MVWWRRVRRSVSGWFSRQEALLLVQDIRNTTSRRTAVVVDLSSVDGFDSRALDELLALQGELGPGQLRVEGLEDAAARLLGLDRPPERLDIEAETEPNTYPMRVSLLYNTIVLQASGPSLNLRAIEPAAQAALAEPVDLVVIDLLGVKEISSSSIPALVELAADLEHRRRRLIIVNVHVWVAASLQHAGLPGSVTVAVDERTSLPGAQRNGSQRRPQ